MSIPQNIVIIWSGSINTIPTGWFLCNGANGTPDLRNRFIVGAGSSFSLSTTGGSANAIIVSHNHASTSPLAGGTHGHTFNAQKRFNNNENFGSPLGSLPCSVFGMNFYTGLIDVFTNSNQVGTHSHSGGNVNNVGSSGVNANLPPYYALTYIMYGGE